MSVVFVMKPTNAVQLQRARGKCRGFVAALQSAAGNSSGAVEIHGGFVEIHGGSVEIHRGSVELHRGSVENPPRFC